MDPFGLSYWGLPGGMPDVSGATGENTGAGQAIQGVASYGKGILRLGNYLDRKFGWYGECAQTNVATEDALMDEFRDNYENNPAFAARVDALALDYAQNHAMLMSTRFGSGAIVAGRMGKANNLRWYQSIPLGGSFSLSGIYGDVRYAAAVARTNGFELTPEDVMRAAATGEMPDATEPYDSCICKGK